MLSLALKRALDWEIHKTNPVAWIHDLGLLQDWQHKTCRLDDKQLPILNPINKRIIINCHRQWGKSTISSLLCFYQAYFFPGSLCLLEAPALRQSSENFRKIIDALSISDLRSELEEDTKLSLKFNNGSRIVALPGSQKTVRGFSAPDLIIMDEAAQADDDLFGALFPMLASNPNSRLILCSTPWGQQGFFYKIWTEGGPEWLKIKVVAADNPRISKEVLDEARRSPNGALWYQQEYEGAFVAQNTQLFAIDVIRKALDISVPIIDIS